MRDLFGKLESPVVTELKANFSGDAADMTPDMLPDLYRGEPLVLAAQLDELAGSLKISGNIGDQPWSVTLPIAKAAEGDGISKLWARRKIADAEVALTLGTLDADDAEQGHSRPGARSSARDQPDQPCGGRQDAEPPGRRTADAGRIPLNLPAGWDFEKVFGEREQPPGRAAPRDPRGCGLRWHAGIGAAASGVMLPKTATDAERR